MAAPKGNTNAAKGRLFARRLIVRLDEREKEGLRSWREVCDALIDKAADSDVSAIKELLDRVDGKALQQAEISGPEGGPIETKEVSSLDLARRIAFFLNKEAAQQHEPS